MISQNKKQEQLTCKIKKNQYLLPTDAVRTILTKIGNPRSLQSSANIGDQDHIILIRNNPCRPQNN